MGCVSSSSASDKGVGAADIDDKLQRLQQQDAEVKKLLLLGAGESGKSTLFKQMIALYGKGFSSEDRKAFTHVVYNNTLSAMQTLVKYSDSLEEDLDCKVRSANQEAKQFISEISADAEIDEEVGRYIEALWQDTGIRNTYEHRSRFQLPDSADYYFGRAAVIRSAGYVPDEQDLLRSRVRTTGIVETQFEVDSTKFKMFDVGGQRNERKKWIHCFENVKAVIFVAAISEYDQVLYEDETTNRVMEALELFDEICNSRWFRDTSIILFLNKKDIFQMKIKNVPLTACFPEFPGPHGDWEAAADYLKLKFEGKNRSKSKEVYSHVTCATDTSNVRHVFDAVKDIIIRDALRQGGLI